MKYTYTLIAFIFFFQYNTIAQDSYEPNNTFSQATEINLNQIVEASIFPSSEDDFYKVYIGQPGVIKVSVTNVPSNLNISYTLYDKNQQKIEGNTYGFGQSIESNELLCDTGFYYVLLTDGNDGSPDQYKLVVSLDVSDVYECNNSFPTATPINLDQEINASIWSARDNDYYKVYISQPGVIKVSVTNVPSNLNLSYTMYDKNQQKIEGNTYGFGQSIESNELLCDTGFYYVLLTDGNDGSPDQYKLVVSLDVSDVYECNNSFVTATAISLDQEINASIWSARDPDYFKVYISQPGVIKVNVTNVPSNLNLSYTLYDNNQQKIEGNTYGFGQSFESYELLCNTGFYYVLLTDGNDGSPDQYKLVVSLDVSDVYECNNQLVDAKDIGCSTDIRASINPANDIDYYSFTLAQTSKIIINVNDVPLNQSFTFTYGKVPSTTALKTITGGNNQSIKYESPNPLDAGVYWIKITDNKGSSDQYTLNVNCTGIVASDDISLNAINIYPNPFTSQFNIDTNLNNLRDFQIYDVSGALEPFTQEGQEINLENSPNGIYYVKLVTSGGIIFKKIVKI